MKKKVIKLVQMKVAEYVEKHNASSEKKINRQECYKKVKEKGFDIKVMIDKLWKIYYK